MSIQTLFQQGYRVRLVVGFWDEFEVRNPEGRVYRVRPRKNACDCPSCLVCKHLNGLQGLVAEQSAMWAQLHRVERDERIGERLDRLSWNLMASSSRIWGAGEMSIDVRYERAVG